MKPQIETQPPHLNSPDYSQVIRGLVGVEVLLFVVLGIVVGVKALKEKKNESD